MPEPVTPSSKHSERASDPAAPAPQSTLRRLLRVAGPGIITGAADDDPSGIATYSIAGAQLGTAMLWTSLLTWPLMAAVQLACARIGMVTGGGLGRALRSKFPHWVLAIACFGLISANVINIGADLGGMADAAVDLTHGNYDVFAIVFASGIGLAVVMFRYKRIEAVLKWLVLSLAAYIFTAFITHPRWAAVWHDLFIPHWPRNRAEWSTLVALLGTTISPYLFFWQSSSEVEEEKCMGRTALPQRTGASHRELADRRLDVWLGTLFSNLTMFFIILSCATTLHRSGHTHIETSQQAAEALRPLAGNFATALYTTGIIGLGLLAIPTLAGSCAYALAETFNWSQGLDQKFNAARNFYRVLLGCVVAGLGFALCRLNPVKALYWSAVINGVLAPLALLGVLAVMRDHKVMHGQPSSRLNTVTVAATILLMAAAAVIMFLT